MILVVLSTHAELASATAPGRSYWETGEFEYISVLKSKYVNVNLNFENFWKRLTCCLHCSVHQQEKGQLHDCECAFKYFAWPCCLDTDLSRAENIPKFFP